MNWPTKALRRTSAALSCAALLLLVAGCEAPSNIGVELPGTAAITTQYIDLPVQASTVRRDSLPTLRADRMLAGRVRDNNSGIVTTARAYSNLQTGFDALPATYSNIKLDSVVMTLAFDYVYGNSAQPAHFDVYQLAQKLDERTAYTTNSSLPLGAAIATNVTGSLNRTQQDTATLGTVATRVLRLPISKSAPTFSNNLFTLLKDASFSQTKLDAFWKGYALVPSAGYNGAVTSFYAGSSGFIVYYHDDVDSSYQYHIGSAYNNDARFFSQITPDLSGAGPLARLSDAKQSVPASETNGLTYIQEGIGLDTKLVIPDLDNLRTQKGISINRAELIVPVKPFSNTIFPYPTATYLYQANNNNRILRRLIGNVQVNRLVQAEGYNQKSQSYDETYGTSSQAIGTLYTLDATNAYYSILVTSYVQAYLLNQLDGELPTALLFSPTLSLPKQYQPALPLTLNRALLDANNIKLRVYYSNQQ